MRLISYIIIVAVTLSGCHSKQQASAQNGNGSAGKFRFSQLKPLPKGVVIDSVVCEEDPSQIYSVYLPTTYDTLKKWPVIYFFDPHGVGNLPVKLYKDLAEKYGFIIAGTYNSKNGMDIETANKAAIAFMRDSYERLSIDNNRIYTGGFSGGAKVAGAVAFSDGGVNGVITCGGGLPEDHPGLPRSFACISFVGDMDFNYVMVKHLNRILDSTAIHHQLIVFHGKHQWTPPQVFEQAFQWLDLNAMRAGYIPKDAALINNVETFMLSDVEKCRSQNNKPQEYFTYKKLVNFLNGAADVEKYADRINQLENSDQVQQYITNEKTYDEEEMVEQQEFIEDLKTKDDGWWEDKISQIKEDIDKDSNSSTSHVEQRILSLLSLVTYMNADGAFNARQYEISSHFVNLYSLVDPANPEHSYLQACLDMKDNNNSQALNDLSDAAKLGFSDTKRLENDSNFVSLHNSTGFKEIVNKIAAKPSTLDLTQ